MSPAPYAAARRSAALRSADGSAPRTATITAQEGIINPSTSVLALNTSSEGSLRYLDEAQKRLVELLNDLPPDERAAQMEECEAIMDLHRSGGPPDQSSVESFARTLFSDHAITELVRMDEETRFAMSAEFPNELVMNLTPNDGHLGEGIP
jgi:hypothetical protein